MIRLNLTKEDLPVSIDEMTDIMQLLYQENEESINKLKVDEEIKCENIFNKKEINVLHGFSMKTSFSRNETNVNACIDEIMMYEDEDEWIAAFKRIKALKNNKE